VLLLGDVLEIQNRMGELLTKLTNKTLGIRNSLPRHPKIPRYLSLSKASKTLPYYRNVRVPRYLFLGTSLAVSK